MYEPPFTVPKVPGLYVAFNGNVYAPESAVPHRAVVIGTMLSTGTGAELTPYPIRYKSEASAIFGAGSMAAEMCIAFLASSKTELWAVGIEEDAAGVKATATIAFTGTATASGSLAFLVGGQRIKVPYVVGDLAADLVNTFVARAADVADLGVAVADGGDDVDLTALWKGASGNDIDVRLDPAPSNKLPPGISVVITPFASGATDPDIDEALESLGDTKYDTIAVGYRDTDNMDFADSFLETRWGPLVQKEGVAFFAHPGSLGDLTTLSGSLNSAFLVVVATGTSPTSPWAWAAEVAAIDTNITQTSPNGPRLGEVLAYCKPADQSAGFKNEDRDTLLSNGISTVLRNANGKSEIERLVTTYTTNSDGFEDRSYYDIATVRLLGRLRFELQVFRSRYKDWKVSTDEALAVNRKVMTVGRLRQALGQLYTSWMADGKSFVQNIAFFTTNLVVEVNESKDGFNTFIPVDTVKPLHTIAGEVAFV